MKKLTGIRGIWILLFITLIVTFYFINWSSKLSVNNEAEIIGLVVGDWGVDGKVQEDVAKKMSSLAHQYNPNFIISTGDNFYVDGVVDDHDPKFESVFENYFHFKSLQVPWYVVVGNHDTRGNVQSQINYSKKNDNWNFPSRYYEITETLVTGEIAQFIYIDTSILVCQSEIPPQSPDLKGGDCLDSGSKEIYQEQLSWLKKQLAKNSRWKIVIGHFPIFSAGNHGDSVELINDILPLFHEFKVDLYFCGHDHTLQHLRQKSVDFVVSGGGGYKVDKEIRDHPQLIFGQLANGFAIFSLNSNSLKVSFYDHDSNNLKPFYTFEKNK